MLVKFDIIIIIISTGSIHSSSSIIIISISQLFGKLEQLSLFCQKASKLLGLHVKGKGTVVLV